jgi:DNA-directed RNA polymerase specialized sigma24 family protein
MEGQGTDDRHLGDEQGSGERGDVTVGAGVDQRPGADVGGLDADGRTVGDTPGSGRTRVVRDGAELSASQLRVDFGAHLEANYQRLVAQLYAITLDPGEAHDVVQDAYSRAWRNWAVISRSPEPSAWIRRVAVRSTVRSWRRVLARFGIGRARSIGDGADPRTRALLAALAKLPAGERRAVVLTHMAGASLSEIAAVEQVSIGSVQARLSRARQIVSEGMADVLPSLFEDAVADGPNADGGVDGLEAERYGAAGYDAYGAEGYGSEGYGAAYVAVDHRVDGDDDKEDHR